MIPLKNPAELQVMKRGGQIAAQALTEILSLIEIGATTWELDQRAEKLILEAGGQPSFKGFEGYPFATCININEGVVHGLPAREKIIREGDLVSIDLGVLYKGFHTDAARTLEVPSSKLKTQNSLGHFLETGKKALNRAIKECGVGHHVGDISAAIQTTIEGAGYYVIRELVGHGVGRELHESPSVPGYGNSGAGPKLSEGMVLAVEVIYASDSTKVEKAGDGWTIVSKDGSMTGLFEDTVAITRRGPIVLTR